MKQLLFATVAAIALPSAASAATLVVDVSGSESYFNFGTAGNDVDSYFIGANSHVTGVAYAVNITAFPASWLSEAGVAFTDSAITAGVNLRPGTGVNSPGTQSFAGAADLVDLGLDFSVGTDGLLRLEYFESFDDGNVSPDAVWNSGTLTFTYDAVAGAIPEPASWALLILGFGAIGGAMRSPRRQAVRAAYA